MKSQNFKFEVFADYHQFYVQDGQVFPDAPENWTDEDVQRRAKVADNVVVICPLRNATVPVELQILDSEPPIELALVDHAVRCSLALPSGTLQVHECTGGEVLRQSVPPGDYGVLLEFSGLGTIADSGLYGGDSYRITLWPADPAPLTVVKAWTNDA